MNKEELHKWFKENESLIMELFNDPDVAPILIKCGIVQNFTTKKFCRPFDICNEEQLEVRISTNPEFANFFQTIYHAGTIPQFIKYGLAESIQVMTTFHYLFDVFKKGIYVQIKDGNIKVYLPFNNTNYINDWGQNLKTKKGNYNTVLAIEEKNHWNPKYVSSDYHTMIQKDPNRWYANYCFFRNTVYKNGILKGLDDEGDKSVTNFLQLITELCYTRVIPDVHFFISPRDFPIVRKDMNHPYDRLYLPGKPPYLGDKYSNLLPIFSQSITNDYADELIPTDQDIKSLLCSDKEFFVTNWSRKKPIAIFRGSASGCGTTPDNNPRLKLYEIAKSAKGIIDAKLIGLNNRIKVDENGYVTSIDVNKYPKIDKGKDFITSKQQSEYKYIIHIEGHVAAFRLTRELAYQSLILKVDSVWKTWYSDLLIGWSITDNRSLEGRERQNTAHYIRIKSDLSDLIDVIEWCKTHDSICENIAKRARKFWDDHFDSPDFMLNYMQNKLKIIARSQVLQNKYKGLILVPYRDSKDHKRRDQLNQFTKFFDANLNKDSLDYKIIVQEDDKLFNRGLLLNKGFLMYNNYDYYIFHDVDLIPNAELLEYYYDYPYYPIHLGYRGQRWSQKGDSNKKFIGGVLSINKFDFSIVNGFPLEYWGWGGEDDALSERLKLNNIIIKNPPKGEVIDLEELSIEEKLKQLKINKEKNMLKIELLIENKQNWFKDGLNNMKKETIEEKLEEKLERLNINKEDEKDEGPWTYNTAPENLKFKWDFYFKNIPENIRSQLQMDKVGSYSITDMESANKLSNLIIETFGKIKKLKIPYVPIPYPASILDAFAGIGGNTLSFAKYFNDVTAMEISKQRYNIIKHNFKILNENTWINKVSVVHTDLNNVKILNVDFVAEIPNIEHYDIIFLDPPWGGKEYKDKDKIDISVNNKDIANICLELKDKTDLVVLKLPLNFNIKEFEKNIKNIKIIEKTSSIRKTLTLMLAYPNSEGTYGFGTNNDFSIKLITF